MKRGSPLRSRGIIRGRRLRIPGVKTDETRWQELRRVVFARDLGLCLGCDNPLDPTYFDCHHRRLRSQLGPDSADNLVSLHRACHQYAHQNRAWAQRRGLILHTGDPYTTPVVDNAGRSWLLLPDGTREALGVSGVGQETQR